MVLKTHVLILATRRPAYARSVCLLAKAMNAQSARNLPNGAHAMMVFKIRHPILVELKQIMNVQPRVKKENVSLALYRGVRMKKYQLLMGFMAAQQ